LALVSVCEGVIAIVPVVVGVTTEPMLPVLVAVAAMDVTTAATVPEGVLVASRAEVVTVLETVAA